MRDELVGLIGRGANQAIDQLPPRPVDVGHVQALFGAEVGVQHRLGDGCQARDLVHRSGVVVASSEHLARHVKDQPLALLAGHSLGGGLR
jgi:hypothetical protein